ncbi:MAG: outer membrane protein transport protein [Methylococcales bacterium]
MRAYHKYALLSALLLAMVLPSVSYATNGYFLIGFGTKSRAMGGTGVAYNMDGMAAGFNPATMIDSDNEFDIGAELFNPPRAIQHDSTTLGQTDEESLKNYFVIPSMGMTYKYSDDITLGFAFIGAGLQTSYNQTGLSSTCQAVNASNPGSCPPTVFNANLAGDGPGGEAGVELMQAQMLPSIAYKIDETHTIGATLAIGIQYFRAEGLSDFIELGYTNEVQGKGDNGVTDEGWDYSFGAGIRLGYLGKFMDGDLNFGVNYSSRVYMSEFERYNNLFAEQGDFDIPENFAIGFAYKGINDVVIAFDIQHIKYSDVAAIGNPGPLASDPSQFYPLCPVGSDLTQCQTGGDLGLGFGWTDQTIYKLGADWKYNDKFNFRAGLNYAESPIPEDQVLFNMLAPATPELHATIGMSWVYNDTYEFSMNYMHAFLNTIKGPTVFGPGGAIVEGSNASIAMEQNSLGFGLAINF